MINVVSSVVAVSHLENRAVTFAVRRLPGREVSEHFCDSARASCLVYASLLNSVREFFL